MFGKAASSSTSIAGEAPRKPLAASLVAENVSLTGELASDGEVHLDGRLRGDAKVDRLVVGETGLVDGTIEADAIEVRGKVRGTITARTVRLHACADVEGDIIHAELAVEAGARFVGRSLRRDAEAAPVLQVVSTAEDAPTQEAVLRLHRRSARRADLLGEGRAHEGVEVAVENPLSV